MLFPGEKIDLSIGNLQDVVDGVLSALSATKKNEINEWEQDIKPCQHVLGLVQLEGKKLGSQSSVQCTQCDLKENLWLCLVCGNLGCGRAQFGGVGGNSHGLDHYHATQHAISVKLGSITSEGTADVFCYICSDEIKDPELGKHLKHWGINLSNAEKTEKSLTELQLEQNMKWDFNMTTDDGKELEPLFGSELTGLKNLGNSCYLSSVVQCLFSLPEFQKTFYDASKPTLDLVDDPANNLTTQLQKLADGLLSGRYSLPSIESNHQRGIAPATFKSLVGRGNEEFSTMRQQDAFEFLVYLLTKISENAKANKLHDPTHVFNFETEQRLECVNCHKVRYRTEDQENLAIPVPINVDKESEDPLENTYKPVELEECLKSYTSPEDVQFKCKSCGESKGGIKKVGFHTFPDVLVINARRFSLINFQPVKLDIEVHVPDELLLDNFLSHRLETDDVVSDDEDEGEAFSPNESALAGLEAMGFPRPRCEKALYNTGNTPDVEIAMEWLFAHMEDPDIDTPLDLSKNSKNPNKGPSQEEISMLQSMGFNAAQSRKALRLNNGNPEAAIDWLFNNPSDPGEEEGAVNEIEDSQKKTKGDASLPAKYKLKAIVCHKGRSIHAGHYVSFIKKPVESGHEEWVLFNDEKVVRGGEIDEMKKYAYIYMFERIR